MRRDVDRATMAGTMIGGRRCVKAKLGGEW